MASFGKRAWTIILLLVTGMICGATGTTEQQGANVTQGTSAPKGSVMTFDGGVTGTLPLVDKPVTLTYWVPLYADAAKVMDNFSANPMFKAVEERTGVSLKFIHPPLKQEAASFKLLLASGDLPDVVEMTYLKADLYPGGPDQAIQDGTFLRLNELIDKYAPNYKKVMKLKPEIERSLKTDSGNIYAFQLVEKVLPTAYRGPTVRTDWLEDLGLPVPETMDDWYVMLKAFKEKKGAKAPLLIDKTGDQYGYWAFLGAFGVIADFYREDRTAKYGPIEPAFRDYLATMHRWYVEGLIDKDFASNDGITGPNTLNKAAKGQAGAFTPGFWQFLRYEAVAEDPRFKIAAVPYPSLRKGQTVRFRQYNEYVRGDPAFISATSKHPVEATKVLDYNYSDQGTMLCNYGIEGVHYTLDNGKPKYTSVATNNPAFPNQIVCALFARHEGPFFRDYTRTFVTYTANALKALEIWDGDMSGMMPLSLTLTTTEGPRYYAIMSDIETYQREMVPKFIMGIESLDKFDSYVAQLKKMNIEEATQIKQAALERYFKR